MMIHEMPGSQISRAKKLGISPAYLCDLLKGKRQPGPKLLEALGLEIVYVRRK